MQVLIINLDKSIFQQNSSSLARLKEYAALTDGLFVVVWTVGELAEIHDGSLHVYPTNSSFRACYLLDTVRLAKKIIQQGDIDLVMTQDAYETGLAGWMLKNFFHLALQVQLHTDMLSRCFRRESIANRIRYHLGKFLVNRADSIRVVSDRIKRALVEEIGVESDSVFSFPIFSEPQDVVTIDISKQNNDFIFLSVGRLVQVKNQAMQIKALARVKNNIPNAKLYIVGAGPLKNTLAALVRKYNLEDSVKFFGNIENTSEIYAQADCFLLTSNYEGWGLVAVEAASHGLPIIMTDVGCAGEVIRNRETGIVIPVGDEIALADSMTLLYDDRDLAGCLGRKAQEEIKKLPTKEETLALYLASWRKAVNNYESLVISRE